MAENSNDSQSLKVTLAPQTVAVSRRSVSLLAWLVPLMVTLAFLFGLMVGNFTANPNVGESALGMSTVRIELTRNETPAPVAMLLPLDWQGSKKFDPKLILPESFQPLNNPTIDGIVQAGGAISRVPQSGITLSVAADASYWLIVLYPSSNNPAQLDRQQTASLSQYFLPLDDLTKSGDMHIELLRLSGQSKSLRIN